MSNDQPQNQFFEIQDPDPGQGFYYLVGVDGGPGQPGSWNSGQQIGNRDRTLNACR